MAKMSEMNKTQAAKMDRRGALYVDFDEDTGMYLILGTESGFAYGTFMGEEEAYETAKEMGSNMGINVESTPKKTFIEVTQEAQITDDLALEPGDRIRVIKEKTYPSPNDTEYLTWAKDLTVRDLKGTGNVFERLPDSLLAANPGDRFRFTYGPYDGYYVGDSVVTSEQFMWLMDNGYFKEFAS